MAERFEIVQKALLQMLEDKKYATLRDILVTMNPSDIAALFVDLEDKQIPLMFRLLPKEQAAETFVEMEPEAQELLIQGFSDNELKEVLDELYADDAADIVEEMPANVVKRILKAADPELRSSINQILDLHLVIFAKQQVLDGDDTQKPPVLGGDVAGINGLLIHTLPADPEDGLLHSHMGPQGNVLRGHNGAGGIFGIP